MYITHISHTYPLETRTHMWLRACSISLFIYYEIFQFNSLSHPTQLGPGNVTRLMGRWRKDRHTDTPRGKVGWAGCTYSGATVATIWWTRSLVPLLCTEYKRWVDSLCRRSLQPAGSGCRYLGGRSCAVGICTHRSTVNPHTHIHCQHSHSDRRALPFPQIWATGSLTWL